LQDWKIMQKPPSDRGALETYLPMLWGAQDYLQALVEKKAPGSLLAEAWEDFYRVYDDLIRRFVVAQGMPYCEVEDCVQEVWSEVAIRLTKFNRPADRPGLRAWLYTLVRSKAANAFRKRAREPVANLDEMIREGREPDDRSADPAALHERAWEKAVLQSVFEQLQSEMSPTNARIMQMRLIDQRSVADVAAELNMAPVVVHARQHRILKKLRARVALYTGEPLGCERA
jgi:RNA polymerase sigma factor (sigma-70 family)